MCEGARLGVRLAGAACYVSKVPCRPCFQLLCVAGITTIVSPTDLPPDLANVADQLGITHRTVPYSAPRRERTDRLAAAAVDWVEVQAMRDIRRVPDRPTRVAASLGMHGDRAAEV